VSALRLKRARKIISSWRNIFDLSGAFMHAKLVQGTNLQAISSQTIIEADAGKHTMLKIHAQLIEHPGYRSNSEFPLRFDFKGHTQKKVPTSRSFWIMAANCVHVEMFHLQ
jgi:hypothetical protein